MKIANVQLNYIIGDIQGNLEKIKAKYLELKEQVDLVVFSELCLTGYYPHDLIHYEEIYKQQESAIKELTKATVGGAGLAIGVFTKNKFKGKPFHNSVLIIDDGVILKTVNKRALPTYSIFEEARHFAPGREVGILSFREKRVGVLVCEDGWADDNSEYDVNPVEDIARQGVDFVLSINASPSNVGKQKQRLEVFKRVAMRCKAPVINSNQVGGQDSIVFDGAGFALNADGDLVGMMPSFEESCGIVEVSDGGSAVVVEGYGAGPITNEAEFMARQAVCGLKSYVDKIGFPGVVIGSSGGIDSAVTIALAVEALGPDRVKAVTMPSQYSSSGSVDDSVDLCNNLGVELFTRPIKEDFDLSVAEYEKAFGKKPEGLTCENMQARIRGRILMEYSNDTGYLVLSTGNKSEISVGYFTLYGDSNGGINVLGDAYKMDVYAMAKNFNQRFGVKIPEEIITKEPSAELAPGQVDSNSLPEYKELDAILKLYIEADLLPDVEKQVLLASLRGTDNEVIERVCRLVDLAEFKRQQAPPIVRLRRRSFGFGRRLPIACRVPKVSGLGGLAMVFQVQ